MAEDPDDATVHYTVKELLAAIRKEHADSSAMQTEQMAAGFARIEVAMSNKADKADVARMETRLDAHGKALDDHRAQISALQIQAREEDRARKAAVETNAWWHGRMAKGGSLALGFCLAAAAIVAVVQQFTS